MIELMKVSGNSLTPEYQDGDFVLMLKIPILFKPLVPGDILVFLHPSYDRMIKKVDHVDEESGKIFVVGTNDFSIDSRDFGMINESDVIGKVIWHIKRSR